ncbi:MAG: ACT domain-containing protein [Planctomycetota bacterium]|jgi:hypothetical protein|nr:ACT domain-containing protein [Planctomycetota bacterium]MDP7249908.1 ACT domain-containing protein [Planctomycetota bacterium]
MSLKVTLIDVWATSVKDAPGALAEKLAVVKESGANLEFVITRHDTSQPDRDVIFIAPASGKEHMRAAEENGFIRTHYHFKLRVEGADRTGMAADIATALADDGINIRGFSAASIGGQFVAHIAFESGEDTKQAMAVLKNME